jgi:hypothetical protein
MDSFGVSILVGLLAMEDEKDVVSWALSQVYDRAIQPGFSDAHSNLTILLKYTSLVN